MNFYAKNIYLWDSVQRCTDSKKFYEICKKTKKKPILCKGRYIQGRCRKSCGVCDADDAPKIPETSAYDEPKEPKEKRGQCSFILMTLAKIEILVF